jgi:hypothetical protein
LRFLLTAFLSVGWLIPLVLALTWTSQGSKLLARGTLAENSFPYFAAARQAAYACGVWAAVAGAIWIGVWQMKKTA